MTNPFKAVVSFACQNRTESFCHDNKLTTCICSNTHIHTLTRSLVSRRSRSAPRSQAVESTRGLSGMERKAHSSQLRSGSLAARFHFGHQLAINRKTSSNNLNLALPCAAPQTFKCRLLVISPSWQREVQTTSTKANRDKGQRPQRMFMPEDAK